MLESNEQLLRRRVYFPSLGNWRWNRSGARIIVPCQIGKKHPDRQNNYKRSGFG